MILQAPEMVERPGTQVAVLRKQDSTRPWRVLSWFGALLVLVGAVDLVLAWYPLGSGAAWEFGMIARTMTALPLPTVGLAMLLAASLASGAKGSSRAVGAVLIVLAVAVLGINLLFLFDVPIALQSAPADAPAEMVLGVKKTIVKTLIIGTISPLVFLIAGVVGIRVGKNPG